MTATTSRKSLRCGLAILCSLLTMTTMSRAAVPSQQILPNTLVPLNLPASSAAQAATYLGNMTGRRPDVGNCDGLIVGPLKGTYTPEQFWIELIKPYCPVVYRRERVLDAPPAIDPDPAGDLEFEFNIPRTSRVVALHELSRQAEGLLLGYLSNDREEELELIGPIIGRMSLKRAAGMIVGSNLAFRWVEPTMVSIEPRRDVRLIPIADMRSCLCNFGLPELRPPLSEHVTVIDSRLSELGEYTDSAVAVMDRKHIDETGASSIPELLQYVSQTAFTRGAGYRLSGAQFAELRGLGAENTLVLLNGRRAYASAADLFASAFDLNAIPLTAVERIEISFDSPSLVHGTDAIGGVVNIVLHRDIYNPSVGLRYGSANGGAAERSGMLSVGTAGDRAKTSAMLDYFEVDQLLGVERDRWRNQDYTRYGSLDQRSQFGAPANVRSLDGRDLAGLGSPFAAVVPQPFGIEFRPGEVNLTSLDAFQAIVPHLKRASFYGYTETKLLSESTLIGEALLTRRDTNFRLAPSIIPGYLLGSEHPQNPFGVPVAIDAALTGLPPRNWNVQSELVRGVIELRGRIGNWMGSAFALHSKEHAKSWQENLADPFGVMAALSGTENEILNVLTHNPGEGAIPSGVLASPRVDHFTSGGTQVTAKLSGQPVEVSAGIVSVVLGVERRREFARFVETDGEVDRNVSSVFGQAKIPIVDSTMHIPAVQDIHLMLGLRHDKYSDVRSISRAEYGITWHPNQLLKVHAAYGESYRPPSLYDLNFPSLQIQTQIRDVHRNETAPIVLLTGGNPGLAPTTGVSSSVGIEAREDDDWRASMDIWHIKMRDRVSLVLPQTLLAYEDVALSGRIVRDTPSPADVQANRRGRLLSLDISRANFGAAEIHGVDLSIEKGFETSVGVFTPRIDFTYTDSFRYGDLPVAGTQMRERAGIASEFGTITSRRAVASLFYEGYGYRAGGIGRYHSAYDDYNATLGMVTGRRVSSRVLWDIYIAKDLGKNVKVTLGATDLRNKEPPYAEVGGPVGFDQSQGDLTGRTIYVSVTGSL